MYFCPDCSTLTKQDSRCRHTYVYNVHKLLLLSTTLQAVYSEHMLIEMRQKAFFRRFNVRINYFWTFLWRTSNLILRPIKPSSLKLKKSKWYSCRSFEVKEWWGMHSDVAVIKLKSNESELAKKKCSFLDYFFFYRSLKLVHLQLQSLGYTSHRRKKDWLVGLSFIISTKWCILQVQIKLRVHILYLIIPIISRLFFCFPCCVGVSVTADLILPQ